MKTYESVWHAMNAKCADEKCRIADLEIQLRQARIMTPASDPPKEDLIVLIKTNDGRWQEWLYTKQSWFPPWVAYWMPLPEVPE